MVHVSNSVNSPFWIFNRFTTSTRPCEGSIRFFQIKSNLAPDLGPAVMCKVRPDNNHTSKMFPMPSLSNNDPGIAAYPTNFFGRSVACLQLPGRNMETCWADLLLIPNRMNDSQWDLASDFAKVSALGATSSTFSNQNPSTFQPYFMTFTQQILGQVNFRSSRM